jgi:hypothetical protein
MTLAHVSLLHIKCTIHPNVSADNMTLLDDKPQFARNPVRDIGVQVDLLTDKPPSS